MIEQIPPQNLEAEEATLGSMMLEEEAAHLGMELLDFQYFYRPANQKVFNAIQRIYSRGSTVDLITIQDDMKAHKTLEESGGTEYLFALVNSVPTAANIQHYAQIVTDMYIRRQIINSCRDSIDAAFDLEHANPTNTFIQAALDVTTPKHTDIKTLAPTLQEALDEFEKIQKGGKELGIPYGIPHLDNLIHGVKSDSEITLIGGRPSAGKTVLLLMIGLQAMLSGHRILFFSQETSAKKLVMRLLRNCANVDDQEFRINKEYQKDAWTRITESCANLYSYDDMFLMNDVSVSIQALGAKAKRLVGKYKNTDNPVGIILVDYLQIVECGRQCKDRNTEVQMVAQGLRKITQDLKIPIVAASQLSRAEGLPSLKHLREGGNQEAEADKIILIDNPPGSFDQPTRPATLMVAKNKDGKIGNVAVTFNGAHMRFEQ